MTLYRSTLVFALAALLVFLPSTLFAQDKTDNVAPNRIILEDDGDASNENVDENNAEEGEFLDEATIDTMDDGRGDLIEDESQFADNDETNDENSDKTNDGQNSRESVIAGHGFQVAMSFNGIPNGIIDHWFAYHGKTWDDVANMGFSLDYFLRFNVPCEMRFSLSWFSARTGSAYWLEKDHADSPILADYVVNNLSFVNLEIAAYHVVDIVDAVAFYYGGGFWGGVLLGDAKSYAIRSSCAESGGDINQCPHEPGSVPVSGLPPVMGFVMVSLGFKFTFLDIMTARLEAGFKGYFYGQLGLGVQF